MNFWHYLNEQMSAGAFNKGFVCGAATVLGAMLVLWLLNLAFCLFHRKSCGELKIGGDDGALSVSDSAVIALVKLLGGEFRELTIRKVRLFKAASGYRLDIQCGFALGKNSEPLSALAPLFKQRIREGLGASLGFSGQLNIDLKLVAVSGTPAPATALPGENDSTISA
ncbi:MAG: hypothetical protein PHI85_02020 [Victivallaceae bacterium]|nr:hypothetical protein [Victivallaceae bacterium]